MADEGRERKDTKRTVLRRARAIVVPEKATDEQIEQALAALGYGSKSGGRALLKKQPPGDVWIVVGEFVGASKREAIEAHAGKPGTPEAIPGAYKAPTTSAWAGGEEYEKPPEPKVERKALVD